MPKKKVKTIEDNINRLNDLMITMLHGSLARVGYAMQPSLGFGKLKIKVTPGINFSC